MEELRELLVEILSQDFIQMIMSGPRTGDGYEKIKVRPVMEKGKLCYQISSFKGKQVFHKNQTQSELEVSIIQSIPNYRQLQIECIGETVTVLVSKKGKITISRRRLKQERCQPEMSHNRRKQYILPEGKAVPFLVDLGVMNQDGNIIASKYDKYRQINRFLEFIRDILPELPRDREITILDFGCGKSYLTFAMYYYLKILEGYNIRIVGMDLKEDVIRHCNQLKDRYGYEKLQFLIGDIAEYEEVGRVDMVVTLHACDTATDYALEKAIRLKASVILSVPCCQHELNRQIYCETLTPLLKHGIIKERFAALATDALRAELLERFGYRVQVLEFIDMEHTPKNLLIRAVKTGKMNNGGLDYERCRDFLGVHPTLERLFEEGPEAKGS